MNALKIFRNGLAMWIIAWQASGALEISKKDDGMYSKIVIKKNMLYKYIYIYTHYIYLYIYILFQYKLVPNASAAEPNGQEDDSTILPAGLNGAAKETAANAKAFRALAIEQNDEKDDSTIALGRLPATLKGQLGNAEGFENLGFKPPRSGSDSADDVGAFARGYRGGM